MEIMNNRSRQSFLGATAETEFESHRIGIVGLCGGGSHVAQQLAHIGFQHFLLCDFDHVDETNLTRMVGSRPSDAEDEEKKTDVIHRLMSGINPSATIILINSRWQDAAERLRDCTVIFGCVDSLAARDELERFCRRFLIPYVDIGMDVHTGSQGFSISGQVALSLPEQPCMRCMGILKDDDLSNEHLGYGAAGGRPQVIWPNGSLASAAVGQFMALILPWAHELQPPFLLEYDGNRQTIRESSKLRHLANITCPHFPSGKNLWDPFH